MKKKYIKPEIEIYNISKKDEVITTSGSKSELDLYQLGGLGWVKLPNDN